jgi:restriction system protein
MAIPDYQTCMLPLLRFYGQGGERTNRESIDALAVEFELTDAERRVMLPSGVQGLFDNRVNWARTYLKKAALIVASKRGVHSVTKRGSEVLKSRPEKLDTAYLKQFSEFNDFRTLRRARQEDAESDFEQRPETPEELLESSYHRLRRELADDLLQRLKQCSPSFFEHLVVDVIVRMGYGGTRKDAGKAIGRSGDDGIDGIIKEDKLGLDAIYIQAKRWENTVGRPEIQKFVGALTGQRAKKGLFITTSEFSSDAEEYVGRIDAKVVLIDGESLAQLMMDHNVGVSTVASYEIKKVDSDYFSEA